MTEEAFRFNNRLKSDFGRFFQALSQVVGKRLTYRKLAAIGDAGFMGIELTQEQATMAKESKKPAGWRAFDGWPASWSRFRKRKLTAKEAKKQEAG